MIGLSQFPDELEQVVYSILDEEVPRSTVFHGRQHTQRVFQAARALAEKEALSEADQLLTLTAALLHDIGYRESRVNHERISADFGHEILPDFGYSLAQVDRIHALILLTAPRPATPGALAGGTPGAITGTNATGNSKTTSQSLSEQILLDACWEYFGAEDRLDQIELLYNEELHNGLVTDRIRFYQKLVAQITVHTYFTKTANAEWQPNKMSLKLWLERELQHLSLG